MSSPSQSVESLSSTTSSQKRQRISPSSGIRRSTESSDLRRIPDSSGNTDAKKNVVAVLLDLADFKCTCCHFEFGLRGYVYQCSNGHAICSSCRLLDLRRCAICREPTPPFYRNLAMEGILEVLRVPCPNAEHGCSEYLRFPASDDGTEHLRKCLFTQCSCPFARCKFTGTFHQLTRHCLAKHRRSLKFFTCGVFLTIRFGIDDRVVLKEKGSDGELVVVDRFIEEGGTKISSTISAKCIAPKLSGAGDYNIKVILSSKIAGLLCWESNDIGCVPGVPRVSPDDNFMAVTAFMESCNDLTISLCIERRAGGDPGASSSSTVRLSQIV